MSESYGCAACDDKDHEIEEMSARIFDLNALVCKLYKTACEKGVTLPTGLQSLVDDEVTNWVALKKAEHQRELGAAKVSLKMIQGKIKKVVTLGGSPGKLIKQRDAWQDRIDTLQATEKDLYVL